MTEDLPTQNRYQKFRRYYRSLEPIFEQPKTRIYTAIIFSFLAISLFGWYAIRPTIQTILTLQKEIEDKKILNQQMEQKIADLIEVQSAYELAKPLIPLIKDAIPANSEPIDAVFQVRQLTGTTTATVSSLQVSSVPLLSQKDTTKPSAATILKTNDFNITAIIHGDYMNIEQYLKGILSMRRILTIQNINIKPDDQFGNSPTTGKNLRLNVQMKSYYKP